MSATLQGSRRPPACLRCRMCGRELVSQPADIVPHEPGPGQVAFEPRKRDPRWAVVPSKMPAATPTSASDDTSAAEEEPGSAARSAVASESAAENVGNADPASRGEGRSAQAASTAAAQRAEAAPAAAPTIQTAAALSARLPPHLAALRRGQPAAASTGLATASSAPAPAACSSHFVEPQPWMAKFLDGGALRGRIECPNARCSGKLGSWDWAGAQCACGAWVTPAFALHASRVDAK